MPITFNPRPATFTVPSIFAPPVFSFTFTNASATGPTGPSLLQLQTAYVSRSDILAVLVANNGYQSYTVSTTGTYEFTLTGASGGIYAVAPPTNPLAPTIDGFKRAPGATVVGRYSLSAGAVITMVVGQGGVDESLYNNPGGGGATFVTLGSYADVVAGTDTLLFAAGGGGGAGGSGTDNYSAGVGQAGTAGGSTTANAGGTLGSGAGLSTGGNSTGGAGYFLNAGNSATSFFGAAPQDGISAAFRKGSVGSRNGGTAVGAGGFGGGGSGASGTTVDNDKGGGGGYSGGGYAFDADIYAGGGGSYASPSATNVTITAGGNTTSRHGAVLLTFLV